MASRERASAISIDQICKTYPTPLAGLKRFFRRPVKPGAEALRDVSIEIRRGEIFGLIGRNGAGKTSLTKIIATLVQPTSGTVTVNGFDSVRDDQEVRAQVGLATAEERSFYWRLTAEQNLLFFARLYGLSSRAARSRLDLLCSQLGLEDAARRRFGELSTGNKQRLAMARAMLAAPPVLLLDEPTRSLDPVAAAKTRLLVSELARARPPVTILLTSHNLAEVEELCGRVAIISRGRIRAIGSPEELRGAHRTDERVKLAVRGLTPERARSILSPGVEDLEIAVGEGALVLRFTRETGDDRLDWAIRSLQSAGATLISCDTERGTLFDVLERYEGGDVPGGES